MRVLGLFSGGGGMELGFERAGYDIIGCCEIDQFARAVLQHHWPHHPVFHDVRGVTRESVELVCRGLPDVIVGGFPCQGISVAGRGAGLADPRSGLWSEMRRIIGECRPTWCVIENVPALRTRGADQVLQDLEALDYTSWPLVVGADDVGAPHRRKRVWIVARANSDRERLKIHPECVESARMGSRAKAHRDDAHRLRQDVAHPLRHRLEEQGDLQERWDPPAGGWWSAEPPVGRVAYELPHRVVQLTALGNAVVPAIPETIARVIQEVEVYS